MDLTQNTKHALPRRPKRSNDGHPHAKELSQAFCFPLNLCADSYKLDSLWGTPAGASQGGAVTEYHEVLQ